MTCRRTLFQLKLGNTHCVVFRVEKHSSALRAHEKRFEEIPLLDGRITAVEEALAEISGEASVLRPN